MAISELEATSSVDWRRVHPVTLLFEFLTAIRQIVFALVLVRIGAAGSDGGGGFADLLEYLFVVGAFGSAGVRWFTTRYRVDPEAVRYEYGLFRRRKQVMPRARIQNVSQSTPFLARLVGMTQLQISDASGGDITMRYVDGAEGDRLAAILRPTDNAGSNPAGSVGEPAQLSIDRLIAQMGSAEAIPVHPPSRMPPPPPSPVESIVLAAPSFQAVVIARLGIFATQLVVAVPAVVLAVVLTERLGWFGRIPPELLGLVGLAPLIVIGSSVSLGKFRLWRVGDELRLRAGMLSEQQISTRLSRIQSVSVERTPVLSQLGYERLRFETADLDLLGGDVTRFLSPAQPVGTWPDLVAQLVDRDFPREQDAQRVSPLTVRRVFLRGLILGLVGGGVVALFDVRIGLVLFVFGVLVAGWFARSRFEHLGYAVDHGQLLVVSGVVFQRVTLLDLDKVQKLSSRESFFQRRLGLVTIEAIAAGRSELASVVIPDLARNDAHRLMGFIRDHSAATAIGLTL